MDRILVHVEGQTEETFVNEILRPHLQGYGFQAISARLVGNARQRFRRGGIRPWPSVKRDIIAHLRNDGECIATTMVDYYGLPSEGEKAWPGRATATDRSPNQRAATVEHALASDIGETMGANFNPNRFIPFVVMHEFEGLLFSDCERFARGIGRPLLSAPFQQIKDQFESPELINDSPHTAPSKRVSALLPEYEKPLFGTLAALEIGLDAMRQACPHFDAWIGTLEQLPNLKQ